MKQREWLLGATGLSVLSSRITAAPAPASKPKGLRPSGFVLMERNATLDGEARVTPVSRPRGRSRGQRGDVWKLRN